MVALDIIKQQEYYTLYMFHYAESAYFSLKKTFQFSFKQLQWLNFLQTIWQTVPYHSTSIMIGTGPYDITVSQVRVNQGVINCLQYF